jgi:hypothetical protein
MSSFDPEDYGLQPVQESVPRNWRREMEQARKAAEEERDKLKAQVDGLIRDRVFAGIPDNPIGNMFRKSYDGELTVEAVQVSWEALAKGNGELERSLAGHAQAQAMAAGAPAATSSTANAELAAMRASARAKRNGSSFAGERAKLGEILAREGVEHNSNNWQLPRQLTGQ